MKFRGWLFAAVALALPDWAAAARLDAASLEAIRTKNDVPALGAYLMKDGKPLLLAATGLRARGSKAAVTTEDLWHIGSDTKAFTATLVARLVEEGKLGFDTTVAEIFDDEAVAFDPDAARITVEDLLSHRAGLASDPPLDRFYRMQKDHRPLPEQRLALVKEFLGQPPLTPPGSKYAYANLGYIILGAVVDRISGRSWETALTTDVMSPLGITHFGLGPPGTPGMLDQPRGHLDGTPVEPPDADNPPVYNSAGRIHISLKDWMKFAQDQMNGPTGGGRLLRRETYARMQTPVGDGDYGFGWGRIMIAGHASIQHAGSNTLWYALIALLPDCHGVLLLTTNDGSQKAAHAMKDARNAAMDPATGLCPAAH
jgi:CubicO group peptidase (beta-lactamase class C family)